MGMIERIVDELIELISVVFAFAVAALIFVGVPLGICFFLWKTLVFILSGCDC